MGRAMLCKIHLYPSIYHSQIHPPVCVCMHTANHPSISIHLSTTHKSIHLFIHLSITYLTIYSSIHQSPLVCIRAPITPPTYAQICSSIHPPTHTSFIHLSIHPCLLPSVHLYIHSLKHTYSWRQRLPKRLTAYFAG